jgi:hypothetical protein
MSTAKVSASWCGPTVSRCDCTATVSTASAGTCPSAPPRIGLKAVREKRYDAKKLRS